MVKLTPLIDIVAGISGTATQNLNNASITAAFNNTLSLDGSTPNALLANLDLNNFNVINSAPPVNNTDLSTKLYVDDQTAAAIAAGVSAAADALATAADRVATNADAAATAADRVATAADAAATAADVITTNADAATAASAVATTNADAAATAADRVATAADAAATAADRVATAADAAATAADAVSTDADATATAADAVSTSNDAANAAASAAAAASSAAEGLFNTVIDLSTSADSPYAPPLLEEGTLYRIDPDTADFVINLNDLNGYGQDMKFAFVKVPNGTNNVIINRGGNDTFEAGLTQLTLTTQYEVNVIIGDKISDNWVVAVQTTATPDNSITHAKYQDILTNTMLGRIAAGTGDPKELTVSEVQNLILPTATFDGGTF